MNIGRSIQTIKELNNYSQTFVANLIGVSQKIYSNFEKSENNISVETLMKLTQLYKITLSKILELNADTILNTTTMNGGISYFNNNGSYHHEDFEICKQVIQSQITQIEILNQLIKKGMCR